MIRRLTPGPWRGSGGRRGGQAVLEVRRPGAEDHLAAGIARQGRAGLEQLSRDRQPVPGERHGRAAAVPLQPGLARVPGHGLGVTVHADPFQCSMRVALAPVAELGAADRPGIAGR